MFNRNLNGVDAVEKQKAYEAAIKSASLAFLDEKNYIKASVAYNEALILANGLHISDVKKCVLKYMLCCCLVQSNKLDDLAEVVMTLQNIHISLKDRLPAIYLILAKAHCKLHRFDFALESLREANDILNKRGALLEVFYIPGTTTPIEQNRKSDLWSVISKECEHWHKPDAVCASKECNNITKPYVTSNANIYISDPAFNGMIIVHCNNKKRPCALKFHPSCWKVKKDVTNLVQKVSDKDIIGVQCFTPNCVDDNGVVCTISHIEIVDQTGEVKARISKAPSTWPVNKNASNASKGAVKKQKPVHIKETETSLSIPHKENVPIIPKNEFNAKKKLNLHDGYDENQLVILTGEIPDFGLTDDSPEAGEKAFLFSYFHVYIKETLVRVCDLYTKFAEISDSLTYLKDIDILTFLLETNIIVAMDDKTMKSSEVDVGEMLDDFINDTADYDTDTNEDQKTINNNDISDQKCTLNACNTMYKEEVAAAGGDTSSCYSSVNTIIDASQIKENAEIEKLKENVASLKNENEYLMVDNSQLKKELQEKDNAIEVYKKQQDECEAIYQKMSDFKARYDEIKDENFKLKEEIIVLINDKKSLSNEIEKLNDSEEKRKEMKKLFQAEFKILQDCINASWEKKNKALEASLKQELEKSKKPLLSQYLKAQFNANKNLLNGYIEECRIALDVISNLNIWMGKYMNVECFKDNTMWMDRLNQLQNAATELQDNFTKLLDKLYTDECPAEISLECPIVPNTPLESLTDIVMNALISHYKSQYELVQNLMQKHQQYQINQQQQQQQINHQQYQISQQQQQQRWQAQQLQRSAAYSMHAYPYVNHPQQIIPFGTHNTPSHTTYPISNPNIVQPPMLQQQHYMPVVQNGITDANVKKPDVEIKEISNSIENLSVTSATSATSSHSKLDLKKKIEEKIKTENIEPVESESKQEVMNDTEKPIDDIDSYFDQLSERREQMRKALKAIALNVQEKAEAENVVETKQAKQYMNGDSSVKTNEKIKGENNSLQLETCDKKSNISSMFSKGDFASPKSKKTAGINSLIKLMQKKYPGALEVDIIEIISEIRKKNNNTLTGKPVIEILDESQEYFSRNQRIHVMHYFLNDESKSSCSESSENLTGSKQRSSLKDQISPVSNISDKFLNRTVTSSVQKNVWNVIPQKEVRWTVQGEIECSICVSIVSKRNCYTLSCRHSFHTECIKKWIKSDRSCPNCRVAVTDDDEFPPLPA